MARLVLINGAPGSGKSTLARLLAQDEPLAMALDVDAIKHSLGQWRTAMPASGVAARRLAIAMASEHLRHGHDVLVAPFLARTHFIVELEALAEGLSATWAEFVLAVDEKELRAVWSHELNTRSCPSRSSTTNSSRRTTPGNWPAPSNASSRSVRRRP